MRPSDSARSGEKASSTRIAPAFGNRSPTCAATSAAIGRRSVCRASQDCASLPFRYATTFW